VRREQEGRGKARGWARVRSSSGFPACVAHSPGRPTRLQGHAFAFEAHTVRIQPGSASSPSGVIELRGVWRGDGQAYQVQLLPTAIPARAVFPQQAAENGVLVRAVPAGLGAREGAGQLPMRAAGLGAGAGMLQGDGLVGAGPPPRNWVSVSAALL
jgi:hypothetical protein